MADSKEPVKRRALLMLALVLTLMDCEICGDGALIQEETLRWRRGSLDCKCLPGQKQIADTST